jgi:hypothetical protein
MHSIMHIYCAFVRILHNIIIYNIRACAQARGGWAKKNGVSVRGRGGGPKSGVSVSEGGGVKNPTKVLANIWMAPCGIVVVNPSLHTCTRFIY